MHMWGTGKHYCMVHIPDQCIRSPSSYCFLHHICSHSIGRWPLAARCGDMPRCEGIFWCPRWCLVSSQLKEYELCWAKVAWTVSNWLQTRCYSHIAQQVMMFPVSEISTILYGNSSTIFKNSQDDSSSSYTVNLTLAVIFFVCLRLVISKVRMHHIAIMYEDSCAHIL